MQKDTLEKMRRKRGPEVWTYRWREAGPDARIIYRNRVLGTIEEIPT